MKDTTNRCLHAKVQHVQTLMEDTRDTNF